MDVSELVQLVLHGPPVFTYGGMVWVRKVFGARNNLRGADGYANDQPVLRIVEQNPDTGSQWAQLALAGHSVLWVFDLTAPSGSQYVGRIVDGLLTRL